MTDTPKLTQQQVFDKVAIHLMTQGRKALASGSHSDCAYRSPEGLCCAAGCLMPDGPLIKAVEGHGVGCTQDLYDGYTDRTKITDQTWQDVMPDIDLARDLDLVQSLQSVHDSWDVCDWHERLLVVAEENNLSAAAIPELPRL